MLSVLGCRFDPGLGAKIPQASQHSQKMEEKKLNKVSLFKKRKMKALKEER